MGLNFTTLDYHAFEHLKFNMKQTLGIEPFDESDSLFIIRNFYVD